MTQLHGLTPRVDGGPELRGLDATGGLMGLVGGALQVLVDLPRIGVEVDVLQEVRVVLSPRTTLRNFHRSRPAVSSRVLAPVVTRV